MCGHYAVAMHNRLRWLQPIVSTGLLVLVVAAVLAACSDDGEPDATRTTDGEQTADEPGTDEQSGGGAGVDDDRNDADPTDREVAAIDGATLGRADLTVQGNRLAPGRGDLIGVEPIDVPLGGTPVWVVPLVDGDTTGRWVVEMADGETLLVGEDGSVASAAALAADGSVMATDAVNRAAWPDAEGLFDDPLPDGRIVGDGPYRVALVEPTDRYPHGVLGDRLEAAAVEVHDTERGTSTRFGPPPPTVIEGTSPLLADVDGDGVVEVLVTHSNAAVGAWLALWTLDGRLVAESDPIGRGNRWRNQLAIGSVGPNGELEIVDVRTPHLGRTVEYFRVNGDRLERVATQDGFTNHTIGSRNLDLGIMIDATGDGLLDVVLPTGDQQMLGVLQRVDDGVDVVARLDLDGRLTTNVAAGTVDGDRLAVAVGTDAGLLRIWPAP